MRKGTLAEFLLASPLRGADLDLERQPDTLDASMLRLMRELFDPLQVSIAHGSLQAACLRFEQRGEPAVYLPLAEVVEYGPALLDNLEQCELVCLDNLDAVAGRADWEEALFHLFNRLRDSGRRLLLSANCSPRELPVGLPDLQSRLTLALVFQLQSLSDEDKLRALQLRASRRGLQLSDEVGRFILTRGTRSMSALFELLERLDQASLQAQRKLTIPFLKATLGW